MSLSEYVKNCCSKIINKLMNKVHLGVFALCYFAKDDVYNCLSVSMEAERGTVRVKWLAQEDSTMSPARA